jgi:hypothetical protein
MAFPPQFLPRRSWQKLVDTLADGPRPMIWFLAVQREYQERLQTERAFTGPR